MAITSDISPEELELIHFEQALRLVKAKQSTAIAVIALSIQTRLQRLIIDLRAIWRLCVYSHDVDFTILADKLSGLFTELMFIKRHEDAFFVTIHDRDQYVSRISGLLGKIKRVIRLRCNLDAYEKFVAYIIVDAIQEERRPTIRGSDPWVRFLKPGAPAVPNVENSKPNGMPPSFGAERHSVLRATAVVALPPASTIVIEGFAKEYSKIFKYLARKHPGHPSFQGPISKKVYPTNRFGKDEDGLVVEDVRVMLASGGPYATQATKRGVELGFDAEARKSRMVGRFAREGIPRPLRTASRFHQVRLWKLMKREK